MRIGPVLRGRPFFLGARGARRWAMSQVEDRLTVAASMKDSLKPLNERVTAVVERFQAAR